MKPIEFPEQNAVVGKDQPQYLPLPAWRDEERTISCWQLTMRERLKLLWTGRVWVSLRNLGRPLQAQLLKIDSPFVQKSSEVP